MRHLLLLLLLVVASAVGQAEGELRARAELIGTDGNVVGQVATS